MARQARSVSVRRRSVLAACAAGLAGSATAGCVSVLGGDRGRPDHDLVVHNETDGERRVSVTVTDRDGTRWLRETVDLKPGASRRFEDEFHDGGTLEVEVDVADGPSATQDWSGVAGTFQVRVRDGEVAMSERGG